MVVASGKVLVVWLRVTTNGMSGGQLTLAVCLFTRDEQDGSTCMETAMVVFAEPAKAPGAKGNISNTSGTYWRKGWNLRERCLRFGVMEFGVMSHFIVHAKPQAAKVGGDSRAFGLNHAISAQDLLLNCGVFGLKIVGGEDGGFRQWCHRFRAA